MLKSVKLILVTLLKSIWCSYRIDTDESLPHTGKKPSGRKSMNTFEKVRFCSQRCSLLMLCNLQTAKIARQLKQTARKLN